MVCVCGGARGDPGNRGIAASMDFRYRVKKKMRGTGKFRIIGSCGITLKRPNSELGIRDSHSEVGGIRTIRNGEALYARFTFP